VALNYAVVEDLLRRPSGEVCGVVMRDASPEGKDRTIEVQGTAVVNATGAWADGLRQRLGARPRLRRLRGGHLIFPFARLPLLRAVSVLHPDDGRPVFAFPWEGVAVVGTTDVDHREELDLEPSTSPEEAEYLLRVTNWAFPSLELQLEDAQGTFAGVRAVVDTGKADPSKESREHVLWNEDGLLTVSGGKLTTFRLMAHSALRSIRTRFSGRPSFSTRQRMLEPPPPERCIEADVHPGSCQRLLGRYGRQAPDLVAAAQPDELESIDGGPSLWAEVRWAARSEGVLHLDDLMLRRLRLGLTLPQGGLPQMDRVRGLVQQELQWDDARWERERFTYERLWVESYGVPGIPHKPVTGSAG
jgi:glycerol-3-phosphate dehydrogenase